MDFLNNRKRFSFKLGGVSCDELKFTAKVEQSGNTVTTVYGYEGGLRLTNVLKNYPEFDACEWVNYIENTSDTPTDIISELWDCDCELPMEHEDPKEKSAYLPDASKATRIYAPTGSRCIAEEFCCSPDYAKHCKRINHLYPGKSASFSATAGRSSEHNAPFFNVEKNGRGYVFAVGWTGQWNAEIGRTEDSLTFKSKIEDTNFRLLPGEKIRTSSVVIMPYEGDFVTAQNKWRRLVKKHFSLIGSEGRPAEGPLCTSVWGGMRSESVIERVQAIKDLGLPIEYIWMDAGWCGGDTQPSASEFEGDWAEHTGDWRISPLIHPNGLCDVADAIHENGMKYILWFEPERVRYMTPIVSEHPEYFIRNGESHNLLLDLGNEEAWNYCFETLSGIIGKLKVDCYRQDFNFQPIAYWRGNDAEDRRGITEIKHITGLYRLWDALLEKFPHMIIDNCASGGRRIDIETLRRSMPLWRSDYQCPANYDVEISQGHSLGFNTWMPYSGNGVGRLHDEYRMRSAYAAAQTSGYFYTENEPYAETTEKVAFMKKYFAEYLRVRPYFSEDFYPLTEFSDKLDVWCGWQLHDPEKNSGVIQLFRRDNAPYEAATFALRGLEAGLTYLLEDADGGGLTATAEELAAYRFEIRETRKAKLYFYKAI